MPNTETPLWASTLALMQAHPEIDEALGTIVQDATEDNAVAAVIAIAAALAAPAPDPALAEFLQFRDEFRAWRDQRLAAPAPQPIPPECDVRKIMIDVTPGPDGMGVEVYAENTAQVVDLLTSMSERLEGLKHAPAPQPEWKDAYLHLLEQADKALDDMRYCNYNSAVNRLRHATSLAPAENEAPPVGVRA